MDPGVVLQVKEITEENKYHILTQVEYEKKKIIDDLKQEWRHRCRKQKCAYQGGRGRG